MRRLLIILAVLACQLVTFTAIGESTLAAKSAPEMTKVTSWASEGITPDLNPGRWVQL